MVLLLKNLLFTVVVPGTVAVYVPYLIAPDRPPEPGPTLAVAILFFLAGVTIYAWCVWDFASFGRGTPAPVDAPKRLVIRGLYRHTRNPMYVGVLMVILGWAILYHSAVLLSYALFMAVCFHLFIILYEERHLKRLFGDQYADYCRRVGRWLPRLRR